MHCRMLNISFSLFTRLQFSLCLLRQRPKDLKILPGIFHRQSYPWLRPLQQLKLNVFSWAVRFCYTREATLQSRGPPGSLRILWHLVNTGVIDCFTTKSCQKLSTLLSITRLSPSHATTNNTLTFWGAFCLKSP